MWLADGSKDPMSGIGGEVAGGRSVATITLNPTVDVALVVEELLVDHKMLATAHRREPGGGGVNVARSLCRLGVACTAVITTGGATGAELESMLVAEGVPAATLPIRSATRESVSLRDASTGNQYRVVIPGPMAGDVGELVAAAAQRVGTAEVVVVSGRLNPGLAADTYRRLALELEPATVVVDCPQPSLGEVVKGRCALIKPSRRELSMLVGRALPTDEHVVAATEEVFARGEVAAVLVSLGADGALLARRDERPQRYLPPPIGAVVSTVGCGDAMVAGVVAALAAEAPLEEAVRFGLATGTAAARTPGTELFDPRLARRLHSAVPEPVVLS